MRSQREPVVHGSDPMRPQSTMCSLTEHVIYGPCPMRSQKEPIVHSSDPMRS